VVERQAPLADVVAQPHRRGAQLGGCAQRRQAQAFVEVEQPPALGHPGVGVGVAGVGQGAGQPAHQRLAADAVVGRGGVQRPPQPGQAGQLAHRQRLDPGIFQQRQQAAGNRHQAIDLEAGRRIDQVRSGMAGRRAVLLPHRARRQVDAAGSDEGRLAV